MADDHRLGEWHCLEKTCCVTKLGVSNRDLTNDNGDAWGYFMGIEWDLQPSMIYSGVFQKVRGYSIEMKWK